MKKAVFNIKKCAACGRCTKVCPKNAIVVFNGMYAEVNENLCIGVEFVKTIVPLQL